MTAIKTAVILAAGLGTRLRPLTSQVPKPLFPILNRPLLGLLLAQVAAAGCQRLAINTHHQGEAIREFVASQGTRFQDVEVRHEPKILGTGGGLKNLADFLGTDPFLVINGDILTDIALTAVCQAHDPAALATLLLHDYPRFNNVWLAADGQVQGFGGVPPTPTVMPRPLAFTGIQVVSPRLLARLPAGEFVHIIDAYRQAIAAGETVAARVRRGFFWQDIGTPQDYLDIHIRLLRGEVPGLQQWFPAVADPYLGPEVVLGRGVQFAGGVCLGRGVRLGDGVSLKNTVIWSGAELAPGISLENCLVGCHTRVTASARGRCLLP
ncbi:MAG: sugar phosphate nucleotidyltransferase [Desulfobacca sp.]|uniref:sugar phosphate nucleotidyltransferase n=1 Tax=Desulfobacca sp. TaxID=2067990 RepID=UPI00404B6073